MASEEDARLLPPGTDGGAHVVDDAGGQLMGKFAPLRIFSFGSFWWAKPLQESVDELFVKAGMRLCRSAPLKWKMRPGIKINTIESIC